MSFLLQTETVLKAAENVGTLLGAISFIIIVLAVAVVYLAKEAKAWQRDYVKLAIETTALIKTVDDKLEVNALIKDNVQELKFLLTQATNDHGKSLENIKFLLEQHLRQKPN